MKTWKGIAAVFFGLIIITTIGYISLNPETQPLNDSIRKTTGLNYIRLSDGFTHYQLDGPESGEVVVLVHGGTIPHWAWDKQIQALTRQGYRVLSYDKFGRGYSDRPDIAYDQALYQRQLSELVNSLSISTPFHLVGVSLGAGTAVNFASQNPNKVDKLVLIAPVVDDYKVPAIFKTPVLGEAAARFVGKSTLIARFRDLYGNSPNSEHYLKLYHEQMTYDGFQRSLLSMLRSDALGDYTKAYDLLGKQKQSTMIIWGTEDKEISREMIDDARSRIPNSKFVAIADSGHGVSLQKANVVNDRIIGFLKN